MTKVKFTVIISNFNGEKYLVDCLESICKTSYKNFELIIVEDGSTDSSRRIIEKYTKKIKINLILNKQNLGLVASRNKAIKIAKGEILVFLDNDTKVDSGWLSGLLQVFLADRSIGAAQCKIFDFKRTSIIQEVGMKLTPYTGFGSPLGRGEKDHGQFGDQMEIIALGAALAVRKEVAKVIGGFDNKLFHYTDDLDFSWRVWISGYKVVLAPNSRVFHYTKIHTTNYRLYFHLCKNSIRMIIKNYQLKNLIIFLPFSIVFNLVGGFYILVSRRSLIGIWGVFLGGVWSLFNLGDTLKERAKIQKLRKNADKEIFPKIMISANFYSIYRQYFGTARRTVSLMNAK